MFSLLVGVLWVSGHWFEVNQSSVKESEGKSQQVMTGFVSQLSSQRDKLVFQFHAKSRTTTHRVSCYRCKLDINEGDMWQLVLRIKPIHSFQNPGGFDYRKWMLAKGIGAQAYVYQKSNLNKRLVASNSAFKAHLAKTLSSQRFPILRAVILGDKSGLAASHKRLIFSTGISHLFVVSGLHVGIVASLFGVLLYWLQRPLLLIGWAYAKELSMVAGLFSALVYGYASGFQVPAMRAFIMLFIGALVLLQARNVQVLDYYRLALLCVILINPLAFMDMGSWLSFGIVLALILGFSGAAKINWGMALVKSQWLAFSIGALILIGFGQAVLPVSMITNLVLIPVFTLLVMPFALLALACSYLNVDGGLILVESGLSQLLNGLEMFRPILSWWLPIHGNNKWLFVIGLLMTMLPRALSLFRFGVAVVFVALLIPSNSPSLGGFQLQVFDVGQGNAALIQTYNKNVLIDTGARFMNGSTLIDLVVGPYLRQNNIRHIDHLHLTHGDNDHSGGRSIIMPMVKAVIDQSHCEHRRWVWDEVSFEQFQAKGYKQGNNGSCLLKVTSVSGQSVLFTGDIEKEAELALIEEKPASLNVDVMIAPHHGSYTSSSERFLDMVNPTHVLISAGFLNHYGHPHEQTLAKYEQRNMMVYTTATHGAMEVSFPPRQEALVVSTYRPNFGLIE